MAKQVVGKRAIPTHGFKKKIVPGRVQSYDQRIFKIQRGPGSSLDVLLVFPERVKYRVVTLSRKGLPDGNKIRWLCSFGLRKPNGEYADNVKYTAFFAVGRGARLVRFQKGKVERVPHSGGGPGSLHGREIVFVQFESGDPAIGIT